MLAHVNTCKHLLAEYYPNIDFMRKLARGYSCLWLALRITMTVEKKAQAAALMIPTGSANGHSQFATTPNFEQRGGGILFSYLLCSCRRCAMKQQNLIGCWV